MKFVEWLDMEIPGWHLQEVAKAWARLQKKIQKEGILQSLKRMVSNKLTCNCTAQRPWRNSGLCLMCISPLSLKNPLFLLWPP
jgi:hypothetical protein